MNRFETIIGTAARIGRQLADPRGWLNARLFVETAYRRLLRREGDPEGIAFYVRALDQGSMNRQQVCAAMINSPEFSLLFDFLSGAEPLNVRLHNARCELVRQLPSAKDILDLGGANAESVEGSLLTMGYPHPAETLTIVDLPPTDRFAQLASYGAEREGQWLSTSRGVKIRYLHRYMTQIEDLPSESVDMIWLGQSIEHIEREEARGVFRAAWRILRPGGHLCLDTPNARLARIQVPNGFIFPEHKYEYTIQELTDDVQQAGFIVVRAKGIAPMPRTISTQQFDTVELYRNAFVSDDPEGSYLFYLECLKA
jgi:SAM-dependent methyltransferase